MIDKYLRESIALNQAVLADQGIAKTFKDVVDVVYSSMQKGGKILVAGNGGSAADAQHFAAEFIGMYKLVRSAMPAIAFTTDASVLTSIANDRHFDHVFERQVEALGKPGDVLFVVTTSGNSNNLVTALAAAKKANITTVALLGKGGGKTKGLADYEMIMPSDNTPRIQETQKLILHSIAEELEKRHAAKTHLS